LELEGQCFLSESSRQGYLRTVANYLANLKLSCPSVHQEKIDTGNESCLKTAPFIADGADNQTGLPVFPTNIPPCPAQIIAKPQFADDRDSIFRKILQMKRIYKVRLRGMFSMIPLMAESLPEHEKSNFKRRITTSCNILNIKEPNQITAQMTISFLERICLFLESVLG